MNIQYEVSKSGHNIIKLNNYYIHSKYDPEREAERIVAKSKLINKNIILFGFGKGYIYNEIIKKYNSLENILIFDPIFKLDNIGEKALCFEGKYQFDEIISFLKKYKVDSLANYHIIITPNFDKIFPKEYLVLLQSVTELQRLLLVEDATKLRFSLLAEENFRYNLLNFKKSASIVKLNKHYSAPVVIASGGPSLTKQIKLLKKYRKKMILIASGSTIGTLLDNEIIPDYLVSVDGTKENYDILKKHRHPDIYLIQPFENNYKIPKLFPLGMYSCYLNIRDSKFKYVKDNFEFELINIPGGGSVANLAFSIAQYITKGPVALIGQDLAYTDGVTHAEGNSRFKRINISESNKLDQVYVEGYYEEKILTNSVMKKMKLDFEYIVRSYYINKNTFNCTEGGAKIKGMKQIPFDRFCNDFCLDEVNIKKDDFNRYNKVEVIPRFEYDLELLQEIQQKLIQGMAILNDKLTKGEMSLNIQEQYYLEELDVQINKVIKEAAISSALYLMQRKLHGLEKYDKTQMEGILENNIKFYEHLWETFNEVVLILEGAILYGKENKL